MKPKKPVKKKVAKKRFVYRCSVTGKIVAKKYAMLNPDTTFKDTIKK